MGLHPGTPLPFVIRVQSAQQLPQMLTSVVKIDSLNRVRKVLGSEIPNPFGAVAYYYLS
jgi:hypothetical protein